MRNHYQRLIKLSAKAWTRPFDNKQTTDIDASILTDHMMLQATELGLGTVWVCFFKPDVIKKEFQLPDNLEPINILAIGYGKGIAEDSVLYLPDSQTYKTICSHFQVPLQECSYAQDMHLPRLYNQPHSRNYDSKDHSHQD